MKKNGYPIVHDPKRTFDERPLLFPYLKNYGARDVRALKTPHRGVFSRKD